MEAQKKMHHKLLKDYFDKVVQDNSNPDFIEGAQALLDEMLKMPPQIQYLKNIDSKLEKERLKTIDTFNIKVKTSHQITKTYKRLERINNYRYAIEDFINYEPDWFFMYLKR